MKKLLLILFVLFLLFVAAIPIGIGFFIKMQMEKVVAEAPTAMKLQLEYSLGYLASDYNLLISPSDKIQASLPVKANITVNGNIDHLAFFKDVAANIKNWQTAPLFASTGKIQLAGGNVTIPDAGRLEVEPGDLSISMDMNGTISSKIKSGRIAFTGTPKPLSFDLRNLKSQTSITLNNFGPQDLLDISQKLKTPAASNGKTSIRAKQFSATIPTNTGTKTARGTGGFWEIKNKTHNNLYNIDLQAGYANMDMEGQNYGRAVFSLLIGNLASSVFDEAIKLGPTGGGGPMGGTMMKMMGLLPKFLASKPFLQVGTNYMDSTGEVQGSARISMPSMDPANPNPMAILNGFVVNGNLSIPKQLVLPKLESHLRDRLNETVPLPLKEDGTPDHKGIAKRAERIQGTMAQQYPLYLSKIETDFLAEKMTETHYSADFRYNNKGSMINGKPIDHSAYKPEIYSMLQLPPEIKEEPKPKKKAVKKKKRSSKKKRSKKSRKSRRKKEAVKKEDDSQSKKAKKQETKI